jgi:secondary thiamine-phosphate synthase enzyme
MILFQNFSIRTPKREVLINITPNISKMVRDSGIKEGICRVFIPHTTAGVTINENADPYVLEDIANFLKKLIPKDAGFSHIEGNSDAHVKSSLIGNSLEVFVHKGNLILGTWQGIMFAEFDGPRNRTVYVQIQGDIK